MFGRGAIVTILVGVLVLAPTVGASAGADASDAIDTSDKAAVAEAYLQTFRPTLQADIGWTGSVRGCDAGSIKPSGRAATKGAVNFVRQLAGLDPVRFAKRYDAKAQKAALVYRAQGDLSHDIPTNWKCFTKDAWSAGAKSNIALGVGGASAVPMYMSDPGSDNALAGHRRWILYPATAVMGSGSTPNTDVLWVMGKKASSYTDPSWVSWPTAGYFPSELEPNGRWSLSGDSDHDYDFRHAKVSVTASDGTKLRVRTHAQHRAVIYGNDTLVWEVAGVRSTGTYVVTVSSIKRDHRTVSHSYTVRLFDPENQ